MRFLCLLFLLLSLAACGDKLPALYGAEDLPVIWEGEPIVLHVAEVRSEVSAAAAQADSHSDDTAMRSGADIIGDWVAMLSAEADEGRLIVEITEASLVMRTRQAKTNFFTDIFSDSIFDRRIDTDYYGRWHVRLHGRRGDYQASSEVVVERHRSASKSDDAAARKLIRQAIRYDLAQEFDRRMRQSLQRYFSAFLKTP